MLSIVTTNSSLPLFSKLSPRFRLRSLRTGSGTIGAGCVSIS